MKKLVLASAGLLLGMVTQGFALTLPPTHAPNPLTFDPTNFAQNQSGSIPNVERSPFDTTTTPNALYDVVFGNSNPSGLAATFAPTEFGGSSGSAGTFKFVDGSPDSYNVLVFNLLAGGVKIFQGSQITTPTSGVGVQIVTLNGIGAYSTVSFGSVNTNSFEFAALSSVPLPASAPMFGAALMGLGVVGFGMKRKAKAAA